MSGLSTIGSSGSGNASGREEDGRSTYRKPGRRLYGIDVARAIAVSGMVMVHFGPSTESDTVFGNLYTLSEGRASVLFVLLAGLGVALLSGGRSRGLRPGWGRVVVSGRLVSRGALLLPIGLWLQPLDHGVLVILQYYAVYFLLAALVFPLSDRWLLTGTAAALIFGPLAYLTGDMIAPEWYVAGPAAMGDTAGKVVRDLLLSGAYPLATWSAPLLAGIWIGRRDLSAPAIRWWLLGGGLAVAFAAAIVAEPVVTDDPGGLANQVALSYLATDEPHSQMPLWMAGSIGSACAVLGGMLLITDRLTRSMWPLVVTGQMALSVYVVHLLLLAGYTDVFRRDGFPGAALSVGAFMLVAAVLCLLWRTALPRGPLEALLAAPGKAIERLIRRMQRAADR